jgi:hypothetical protein
MEERFLKGGHAARAHGRRRIRFPRWIVNGLLRLAGWVLVVAAVSAGVGLLVGQLRGSDASRSVPLGLYVGGAGMALLSLLGTGGRTAYGPGYLPPSRTDLNMRQQQAMRGAYALVGVCVIGLGIFFDWLL